MKTTGRTSLILRKGVNSPLGSVVFIVIAICLAYLYSLLGNTSGLLTGIGGIGGIIIVTICLASPKMGFYLTVTFTFFAYFIQRALNRLIPLGGMTEVLIISTFIGVVLKMLIRGEKRWPHSSNPISYAFLVVLLYLLLEIFNPNKAALDGWFFKFRKFLEVGLIYFTTLYIFDSLKSIKIFLKFWLLLSFIAALYACYEQWVGLPGFEYRWIISDPVGYRILLQSGNLRKFSFLADPPTFGAMMSMSSLFCLILSMGINSMKKKSILIIMAIFMLLGMSFSGTRTATAMIVAGVIIYGLVTIRNKKTVLFLSVFALGLISLIFLPIHSISTINRLRSTFNTSQDPSLNVRDVNRRLIQPIMHANPIGTGPATVGADAQKYNPENPLAHFPPDSGYVLNALEFGWIGLGLIMLFYFIGIRLAISNYFRTSDQQIRTIYAGIITAIFICLLGEYAQSIISQITLSTIFFPFLGIVVKLKTFDETIKVPYLHKNNH